MALLRNRFVVGIGALVLLLAGTWAYFAYFGPQPPSRPLIIFEETVPESGAVADQPVVIFALVSDPEGIAQVELWVNGEQVATQTNDASSSDSFHASLAFIPTGAGNYLTTLRALDGAGYSAESDPLAIFVSERNLDEAAQPGEYIAQEGDTPESLAELFGTSVEDINALNPDVGEIGAGTPLLIPASDEGEAAGDPADGVPLEEDLPRVDPPDRPSPPSGEAIDAEPVSDPWWSGLPLPSGFVCFINPASCARSIGGETPPFPPPSGVSFDPIEGCAIGFTWTDNSENETGFRLYRVTQRPRFAFEVIGVFGPQPGTGRSLHFVDTPSGTVFYVVAAYNALGTTWGAPSEEITSAGCPVTEPVAEVPLVIEALYINVEGTFDRLYCYVSLLDSAFERVPAGASNFITIDDRISSWNIFEHFGGRNKRLIIAPSEGPVDIAVECLGWNGDVLARLGRFSGSHLPNEWDGRWLTGSPSSDAFTLTYRILHTFGFPEGEAASAVPHDYIVGDWPLVHPDLPVPFNLRETDGWTRCDLYMSTPCESVSGRGFAWDYPSGEGLELLGDRITVPCEGLPCQEGYRVYRRSASQTSPSFFVFVPTRGMNDAPISVIDCHESTFFSVSAVWEADFEFFNSESIHSAISEEMEVPPTCASLEITLDFLWVYGVNDGDPCTVFDDCHNDYEAYGWMSFNGQRVRWNDHCDPGFLSGCLYTPPSYSRVGEASEHQWSSYMLNIGDGWRRRNNIITVPITDGETLDFMLTFRDHDSGSADDLWCGGTGRVVLREGPHSAVEWLSMNQSFQFDDGNCIVGFTVRGVP